MARYTQVVAASISSSLPTLEYERALREDGYRRVAGVDEVGRGSLAGPVVAAAVILPEDDEFILAALDGVRDSKQLNAEQRTFLSRQIFTHSVAIGFGWSSHHIIDRAGISAANRSAMARSVRNLRVAPNALLLDHFRLPESDLPQVWISKGDTRCLSIAAASVVAKVVRDAWMSGCERRYPGYGFGRHKGYGTREHLTALAKLGPSPLHRRSFAPVATYL